MSRWTKLLIVLIATLAAAGIAYGPLGFAASYVDRLEVGAKAAAVAVPTASVHMSRAPLSRRAILIGTADPFQRRGIGSLPGIDARVASVPGISSVRWNESDGGIPLLVELLVLTAFFFMVGVSLGWVFFREKPEGYL
jgi:hypothetical protein